MTSKKDSEKLEFMLDLFIKVALIIIVLLIALYLFEVMQQGVAECIELYGPENCTDLLS